MKNYKTALIICLVLVALVMFIGFKVILSLKEQNNALSSNIDQITKRIAILELDKTMVQVSALKAKNTALKIEIDNLKAELGRISKKLVMPSASQGTAKDIQRQAGLEKNPTGNKGFLTREGKPTQ